jgi:hypothetical protein
MHTSHFSNSPFVCVGIHKEPVVDDHIGERIQLADDVVSQAMNLAIGIKQSVGLLPTLRSHPTKAKAGRAMNGATANSRWIRQAPVMSIRCDQAIPRHCSRDTRSDWGRVDREAAVDRKGCSDKPRRQASLVVEASNRDRLEVRRS